MNKGAIVKIAGFLVVPIILMLVVTYLLYPLMNKERYDLIVRTNGTLVDSVLMDSLARMDSLAVVDSALVAEQLEQEQLADEDETEYLNKVDSLERMIYLLSAKIDGLETSSTNQVINVNRDAAVNAGEEEFKDRVKSLLNLEENEMAPILEKMTGEQLLRLYREAGNTQREKILRALNSDRAARLITEVML